jgi:putative transposase
VGSTFRAYKFRFYPSKEQTTKLTETLRLCTELYNAGLEQRRMSYKNESTVTYRMQQNELPELRDKIPDFKQIYSQVLQDVIRRLDRAFANFGRI